jgi:glycosyltransferase involved in cell wall biosynthesis
VSITNKKSELEFASRYNELEQKLLFLEAENRKLKDTHREILSSTSWKITYPVRKIGQLAPPSLKAWLRRGLGKTTNLAKKAKNNLSSNPKNLASKILKKLLGRSVPGGNSLVFNRARYRKFFKKIKTSASARIIKQSPPLISIILPTRDRARTVIAAIESVIAQSYKNWELLVIDDGSKDNTIELINSLFSDPRIKILQSGGLGVCEARNCGLRAATGEYIAYLDSDNTWTQQYLELMLLSLMESKADSAYSVLKCINQNPNFYRQHEFNYQQLKIQNYIDLNVFMHKAAILKEIGLFDIQLKRMVDWDLILRITKNEKVSFAYFVGALYDSGPSADRITNSQSLSYLDVVRNKHWVDWERLQSMVHLRDPNLTSVIICVYNQPKLTDSCLRSIFTHEAGSNFELILVDNGSDATTKKVLSQWKSAKPKIKIITNPTNFNFALGNNIGFSHSTGANIVFLNNDTEVSPEWLRSLVAPLQDPKIKGTQPKLIYPDSTIQCVGLVFNNLSPLGYPIYSNFGSDFGPTTKARNFSALTAACLGMRAADFAAMQGFDPIFTNGQEDLDLCLRLGGGERVFRYVPDSIVTHHESKTRGRGANIERNRKIFCERWAGRIKATDLEMYTEDGLTPDDYVADNSDWISTGHAVFKPVIKHPAAFPVLKDNSLLREKVIAIKIGCPRPELKDNWGDYHFATSIAQAIIKKGLKARVDFLHNWESSATPNDINLVVRGLSRFKPNPETINLMWLISHPQKVANEELSQYDYVFIASESYANTLREQGRRNCSTLMQCTDPNRFYPRQKKEDRKTDLLFVANSRKVLRDLPAEAIKRDIPITIYGEMWEDLVPANWVKGSKILNAELPDYYSAANIVLNDHWADMRELGFVSNRIFDALACGSVVVSDEIQGIPEDLRKGCVFYSGSNSLESAIKEARKIRAQNPEDWTVLSDITRNQHSFDSRVSLILERINQMIITRNS